MSATPEAEDRLEKAVDAYQQNHGHLAPTECWRALVDNKDLFYDNEMVLLVMRRCGTLPWLFLQSYAEWVRDKENEAGDNLSATFTWFELFADFEAHWSLSDDPQRRNTNPRVLLM
jgi:hypothetical protein